MKFYLVSLRSFLGKMPRNVVNSRQAHSMTRILTIEDDAVTAREIVAELSSHGLDVDWVDNGREGAGARGQWRLRPDHPRPHVARA
jgi:hypothetical protein